MKKQSPVGLFFGILLRAVVIIFGVAIVAFGIFFLSKVIGDGTKADKGPVTTLPDSVLTDVEGRDDLIYNTAEHLGMNVRISQPASCTFCGAKRPIVDNSVSATYGVMS